MVTAPLSRVGNHNIRRDGSQRSFPGRSITGQEIELKIGSFIGVRAVVNFMAQSHVFEDRFIGARVVESQQFGADLFCRLMSLLAGLDDAVTLAPVNIQVDLAQSECVGFGAAPVNIWEK